ncbi:unnamed protein product [Allacma fusca]|uniref:Uncharacterized protein n=1 Tax=Allacma fusca TaxID=39272 RepID=A0A8J2LCL2_9HEXA|nr:unnamed protein product [Allacma fusca]
MDQKIKAKSGIPTSEIQCFYSVTTLSVQESSKRKTFVLNRSLSFPQTFLHLTQTWFLISPAAHSKNNFTRPNIC